MLRLWNMRHSDWAIHAKTGRGRRTLAKHKLPRRFVTQQTLNEMGVEGVQRVNCWVGGNSNKYWFAVQDRTQIVTG